MKNRRKVRVLVVDDHNLVRSGIAMLLASQEDIEVIDEASDGKEAIEKATAMNPDVVLMDISMPHMDGIKAALKIHRASPSTKVLMMTQYEEQEYVKRVMHSGISGYILKSSLLEDLVKAIRAAHEGKKFVTSSMTDTMLNAYFTSTEPPPPEKNSKRLTNREREILQLVAEGCTNLEASRKLAISVRTVEFHRTNIMEKLGIHDTAHLVKYAILNKLVDLDD
jgi:DNA-binding NarL/FixJ family response regulator